MITRHLEKAPRCTEIKTIGQRGTHRKFWLWRKWKLRNQNNLSLMSSESQRGDKLEIRRGHSENRKEFLEIKNGIAGMKNLRERRWRNYPRKYPGRSRERKWESRGKRMRGLG